MTGVGINLNPMEYSQLTLLDTWGASDVQEAVDAVPDWMEAVGWNGPKAALDDWIVSGHSNGGAHFPCPFTGNQVVHSQ